jgi:hypothetical protein
LDIDHGINERAQNILKDDCKENTKTRKRRRTLENKKNREIKVILQGVQIVKLKNLSN